MVFFQLIKNLIAHIDLAANLHLRRHGGIINALRDGDGGDVGTDILAARAIPPSRTPLIHAVLVEKIDRQAINLCLTKISKRFLRLEKTPDALCKLMHVLLGMSIVQRQHGRWMNNGLKTLAGGCANGSQCVLVVMQLRKSLLQQCHAAAQFVILPILNFWLAI